MERRTTRRTRVSIQALLSTLHEENGATRTGPPVEVWMEEISGRGARIRMPLRLRPGTLVQMETGDDLFLGEVIHCRDEQDGFVAGVEIDCVLHAVSGVRALMRALLEEAGAGPGGDAGHPERNMREESCCPSRQNQPA